MSQLNSCSFDKNYLANATILFIENDDKIRFETSEIFTAFFKKVLIAKEVEEGIYIYQDNKASIDLIITDIDFPNYKGIDILSQIRSINWEVPILITTTFSDMNILIRAIKFNLSNYIVKPIQLNTTLKIISEIIKRKQQKKELAVKDNELRQFMSILDSCNIICEMDLDFKIRSANDAFLINSEFGLDELIGMPFNDQKFFKSADSTDRKIIDTLRVGKTWVGLCKKLTKQGVNYYTHSTPKSYCLSYMKLKNKIEF